MTEPTLVQEDVGLVVAAGGSGRRFAAGRCKVLEPLAGLPVVAHCLRRFAAVVAPELTVLVVPEGGEARFREALSVLPDAGSISIVPGGALRQDSVAAGLRALPGRATFVVVQDAARPYSSVDLLLRCIRSARLKGSGVAARPVTDTIKVAGPEARVIHTPERTQLWASETPQVFRRCVLAQAYAQIAHAGTTVTDDAQAVEVLGEPVYLVKHEDANIKITYASDLPVPNP